MSYDIDTLPEEVEAYAARQRYVRPEGSSAALEVWKGLSIEDRRAWAKLSDGAKIAILRSTCNKTSGVTDTSLARNPNGRSRQVNLSEVADDDPQDTREINTSILSDAEKEERFEQLVNLAATGKTLADVHPGNINRVLAKNPKDTSRSLTAAKKQPSEDRHVEFHDAREVHFHYVHGAEETDMSTNTSDDDAMTESDDVPDLQPRVSDTDSEADEDEFSGLMDDTEYFVKPEGHIEPPATYHVSLSDSKNDRGSLCDRGANGGAAGSNVRVISQTGRKVDITGIDNHKIPPINVGTVGAVVTTHKGDVIAIFHEYALCVTGKTIHSGGQLEWAGNKVCDRSIKIGGTQVIETPGGYKMPLDIIDGLPWLPCRPYTDDEWTKLPHVIMTADERWDPKVLDYTLPHDNSLYDPDHDPTDLFEDSAFDATGELKGGDDVIPSSPANPLLARLEEQHELEVFLSRCDPNDSGEYIPDENFTFKDGEYYFDTLGSDDVYEEFYDTLESHERDVKPSEPDYEILRPYFLGAPANVIKKTYGATTQMLKTMVQSGSHIRQHFRSPNPASNVSRRNEPVATDMFSAGVPAVDCGHKKAQFFVGRHSLLIDVYGITTDSQFVQTLWDVIKKRGAMTKLISDHAISEIGNKVKKLLRSLCIHKWSSEPHHQSQNYAERRYQNCKHNAQHYHEHQRCACLCMVAVCAIYVALYHESYGCRIPQVAHTLSRSLTGQTPDISIHHRVRILGGCVLRQLQCAQTPDALNEQAGWFVGFADTCW